MAECTMCNHVFGETESQGFSELGGEVVGPYCDTCSPSVEIARKSEHIKELEELVGHCWLYSGHEDCGRRMMGTDMKEVYDDIMQEICDKLDADEID